MSQQRETSALENERDFLLASIEDLDAEFEAGDLNADDYQTLRDGYVARAANLLREMESNSPTKTAASDRSGTLQTGWKRRVLTFAGVGAVALVAGLALAQALGYRSPADTSTGEVRQTVGGVLNEADALGAEGRWDEALDVYDEILVQSPANVEALTYKGWVLHAQFEESDEARDLLAEAVAADPDYPDARVFSALLARGSGNFDEAADHLVAFDQMESVPPQMTTLVDNGQLRSEVLAERYLSAFESTGKIAIDERFALDESSRAAVLLDSRGDVVAAIATFDAVLALDPENRLARLGLGRRLAATPELVATSPELAERGLALLDDAVADDPDDAEALAYRALARVVQGDEAAAREDLGALDALEQLPDGLLPIVDELHRALDP